MRVLFVVDGLWVGGTERSTAELLPYLVDHGIDVSVVCLKQRTEGVEASVLSAGVELQFLPRSGFAGQTRALRKVLRSQSPDIVHSALYRSNMVTRVAAAGLPVVVLNSLVNTPYEPVRFDDPDLRSWKLRVTQFLDAATGRVLTDHFHAVSNAVAESAEGRLRIQGDRISVVGRGRDRRRLGEPSEERRASVRAELGLRDDQPVTVAVGRQDYQKGYNHLIEALVIVNRSEPSHVCLIAGREGSSADALERQLEESDAGDLRLLGHRDDVPDLLAAADIYVTTSLFEGMPGTVIEAMAMDLPVVGFDIPPVREVVEPDRTARLCEVGDARSLAAALVELHRDGKARAAMGEAGRRLFESQFTLESSAEGMIALYDRLLA